MGGKFPAYPLLTVPSEHGFSTNIGVFLSVTYRPGSYHRPLKITLYFRELLRTVVPIDILYYYVTVFVFALGFYLLYSRLSAEFGWALLAIKEEPMAAESAGIDTRKYRLRSFTISGLVCGAAGAIYAPLNGYLSPATFNLGATIDIILAGVIGGITTPAGALIGGSIVIVLPEFLRFLSEVRMVVYGTLLILLLIYFPEGAGSWLRKVLFGD